MIELEDVLKKLQSYKKIYVTGAQRSGTTFAARYMAKMLGYKHIDEHDFGTHNFQNMLNITQDNDEFVIQCPAQTHNILSFPLDNTSIVVYMNRDFYDIITSEHRIDWHTRGAEYRERAQYEKKFRNIFNKI